MGGVVGFGRFARQLSGYGCRPRNNGDCPAPGSLAERFPNEGPMTKFSSDSRRLLMVSTPKRVWRTSLDCGEEFAVRVLRSLTFRSEQHQFCSAGIGFGFDYSEFRLL